MVSKSMTCTSLITDMARSFNSSQPNPPAPTTKTFEFDSNSDDETEGSNSPIGNVPSSFAKGEDRFNSVDKDPRAGITTFDDADLDLDKLGLFSSNSYVFVSALRRNGVLYERKCVL